MTTGRLQGKTALITAAGQGIGAATTAAFAREGAKVLATDINEDLLKKLAAAHPTIKTRLLDVRDINAVNALAAELGAIDILFNCAGFVHQGTILDCSESDWDFSFDLNVKSMYRTCRAFIPAMAAAKKGSIINMSSGASSIKGAPNRFVYGTTKAAVIGLTKALAVDFIKQGVRVNAICPGLIETNMTKPIFDGAREAGKGHKIGQLNPLQRAGVPEEIAAMALFLAGDESSYVNGQAFPVDGGLSSSLPFSRPIR